MQKSRGTSFGDWKKRFHDLLHNAEGAEEAKKALERLIRKGCKEEVLLRVLWDYTSRRSFSVTSLLERWGYPRKRLKDMANRIEKVAKEIRSLNDHPNLSPVISFRDLATGLTHDPKGARGFEIDAAWMDLLPGRMMQYAGYVRDWPPPPVRKRGREPNYGQVLILAILSQYIWVMTNRRYYPQLALLLEVAKAAQGRKGKKIDQDAVERRLQRIERQLSRFRKRNPGMVKALFAAWMRGAGKPKTRSPNSIIKSFEPFPS